ncbi:MAG: serine hydrolase domain-containing protein [Caulobacter sp.]|nr:serine hydrolase domain-containing protein [Caulobacter sp.]
MTLLRRTVLAAIPAAALAGRAQAESTAATGSLERLIEETGVPALAGAVVTPDGLPFLAVDGVRRAGGEDRVTTDDLWHLGSNTKAMTAALYGRLVEAGRARWGATLPQLFPDLTLNLAWSATTVEQLMSHTAGLTDRGVIDGGWLMASHRATTPVDAQRTALADRVLGAPPGGKPGQFDYANLNYILAGAAIERITGTTWEAAITTHLFTPLGLTTAGFGAPKGNQPWGHRRPPLGVGGLIPVDPAGLADNPPALGPAGTVHMTLTDYSKFVRLFLTRGGDLLRPETVAHLTTPPTGRNYALGWGVVQGQPWARGVQLAHEGSNTMWHMLAVLAPERGLAFITAANVMMPDDRSAPRLLFKQLQQRFAPA